MLRALFSLRGWLTEWDDLLLEAGAVVWAHRSVVSGRWRVAWCPFHHAVVVGGDGSTRAAIPCNSGIPTLATHISFVIASDVVAFGAIPGSAGQGFGGLRPSHLETAPHARFQLFSNGVRTRPYPNELLGGESVTEQPGIIAQPIYWYGNVSDKFLNDNPPLFEHEARRGAMRDGGDSASDFARSLQDSRYPVPSQIKNIIVDVWVSIRLKWRDTLDGFWNELYDSVLTEILADSSARPISGLSLLIETCVGLWADGRSPKPELAKAWEALNRLGTTRLATLYRRIEDPTALLRELGRMEFPSAGMVVRQTRARDSLRAAMGYIEDAAAESGADPKLLAAFVELDALGYLKKLENSTDRRPLIGESGKENE